MFFCSVFTVDDGGYSAHKICLQQAGFQMKWRAGTFKIWLNLEWFQIRRKGIQYMQVWKAPEQKPNASTMWRTNGRNIRGKDLEV